MCQNYTYDLQTQMVSRFRGVSATDGEVGSNLCPDEKGTESWRNLEPNQDPMQVATYAPMKRGLKVFTETYAVSQIQACSNLCPDEKGTESHHGDPVTREEAM